MKNSISYLIGQFLEIIGYTDPEIIKNHSHIITQIIYFLIILLFSYLVFLGLKKIFLNKIKSLVLKTKPHWDDNLYKNKVLHRIVYMIPALVLYILSPIISIPLFQYWIQKASYIYIIIITLLTISAFIDAIVDTYQSFEISKGKPIKSYLQLINIIIYLIGGVLIISTLLNSSPWGFLTGIGALTAVLIVVFKDTILGLVASIQISASDVVMIGDWIEMPQYGADGNVIDISLHTVKIQNWDMTISTIPTYSIMSQSFKNWRGMQESGGRRIKRSIKIDMNSIQFCTDEMIKEFRKVSYIREYLDKKQIDIGSSNQEKNISPDDISGRRMTNIGTFRQYIISYLRQHPKINQEMTLLVRQLDPGENGLPVEIYVFSSDQEWVNYESIQSDIFDHVISVIPVFGLKVFQNPSGQDFKSIMVQK